LTIRVGKGRSAVSIDGPIGDGFEREIRELLGPVLDEIERTADEILATARLEWPVKSGASRDGWRKVLTIMPGEFTVEVSMLNSEPYVPFIRSTQVGNSEDATRIRSPLQTLIRKPATLAKRELKKSLPKILASAIEAEARKRPTNG